MKHYEVVFVVHPDQREQVSGMVERYSTIVQSAGGVIHRIEDWGRRQLAYPIQKLHKAHYVMMNIECMPKTLLELEHAFRFSDAVLRYIVIRVDGPIIEPSIMMREERSRSLATKKDSGSASSNTESSSGNSNFSSYASADETVRVEG